MSKSKDVSEEFSVLDRKMESISVAQKIFATYSQEQVDKIFKAAALAANRAATPLAYLAVKETSMGLLEDKKTKNRFASEEVENKFKSLKTCGIIEHDKVGGLMKIAKPKGVVLAIVPCTNPTSTAIFKALIALKTRNGVMFAPHPRAKACTVEAAKVVLEAAVEAGAPAGIIGWVDEPSLSGTDYLMHHPKTDLILATGGPSMVHSAYASGNPAIGVGAGNTPVLVDETANIENVVGSVMVSKVFDYGLICASEQSVVVLDSMYKKVRKEFTKRGAYFLSKAEQEKLAKAMILEDCGTADSGKKCSRLNPDIIGQSVQKIADIAGIVISDDAHVLVAEVSEVGDVEPYSREKLTPILAMYKVTSFERGVDVCAKLIEYGGLGHTAVIYADVRVAESRIAIFRRRMSVMRVLINMPASQGAIGDLYNFRVLPSLTLGGGSLSGGSVSGNVGPMNLLNVQVVAERRENMLWLEMPKIRFGAGCLPVALQDIGSRKKAFIVTDKPLYDLGALSEVRSVLESMGVVFKIFYDVEPDPTLETVAKGLEQMKSFKPDVIIAFGGGSPMDAAKIMKLMYQYPEVEFAGLSTHFMDIKKRVYTLPALDDSVILVAIPTTSGTGSEVTPFAVITDQASGEKHPIADYVLMPEFAIIDSQLVQSMPAALVAYGGVDALTHALESLVSVFASNFTTPYALESIRLLFKYLPDSYNVETAKDFSKSRERVHYAATIAGVSFGNTFLGICHSLAHKLGAEFHIPHGLANALMIAHVIRYNATDAPPRMAAFSKYQHVGATNRYAAVIDSLGLGREDDSDEVKVALLISMIEELKLKLGIPTSIKEALPGVSEAEFMSSLDKMSDLAHDDQCTGTNPRDPLVRDLRQLYVDAYHGS